MHISLGFSADERPHAAALFMQAFGQKLRPVLGTDTRATSFVATCLNPNKIFCARDAGGKIMGIAGIKLGDAGFLECDYSRFVHHFGPIHGIWRAWLMGLFDYKPDDNSLYLDGICVDSTYRGRGGGTDLIAAVDAHARSLHCTHLRLQVIDTNTAAIQLYMRHGFSVHKTEKLYFFAPIFGFKAVIDMVKVLEN